MPHKARLLAMWNLALFACGHLMNQNYVRQDGLLLELHAISIAACSYVLLLQLYSYYMWYVIGQVENAEVRKPKYGNGSMETEVRK